MRLRSSLDELERKNKVLMSENQELEKEIYLLRNSPTFQEKVAREEYGYIYPGETVYTFSGADSDAKKEAAEPGRGPENRADP
jgi:cell division protein FtsB